MSRPLTELKTRVIEYLGGLEDFAHASVTAAYPEQQRAFPLKKPVVTVEVGGLDLSPAGLGAYLGGSAPLYGAAATVLLRFGIYCDAAEACGGLFEALCDALLNLSEPAAVKISCEKLAYDAKTASYLLFAAAEVKNAAWILERPQERLFSAVDYSQRTPQPPQSAGL